MLEVESTATPYYKILLIASTVLLLALSVVMQSVPRVKLNV